MLVATKLRLTPRSNRYAGDDRDGARHYPRPWESRREGVPANRSGEVRPRQPFINH
jgi:hypothetical protein